MGIYANNAFAPAIKINQPIIPSGTLSITAGGLYNVYSYSSVNVSIEDLLDLRLTSTRNLSLNEYVDMSASKINQRAFYNCYIGKINMPNVTRIESGAFFSCSGLTSVTFPACTYIDDSVFTYCKISYANFPILSELSRGSEFRTCSNLISISLPECTKIATNAFAYCSSLETVYCPKITYVGTDAFWHCEHLISFPMSLITFLGNYAFEFCYKLESANLLALSSVPYQAFWNCSALSYVSIPLVTILGEQSFDGCISLTNISAPHCTQISTNAFSRCYNLLSVYLNVSAVPSLSNINAFNSTPISNYTTSTGGIYGSIFVPTSLYSSFIAATNWATYSSRIVSMNF